MLNEVPNFAWSVGYTNASWTLRVDSLSKAVADLIQHMRAHGYTRAYPTLDGATPPAHGLLELDSGYVRRVPGCRRPRTPPPGWCGTTRLSTPSTPAAMTSPR